MKSFAELESENQFLPILKTGGDLAGYIHLDGSDTKVSLTSEGFHHFDGDEVGWFELEVVDRRGSQILLHNALNKSSSMPGLASGKRAGFYTSEIYPNVVIVGAENLRKDRTLSSLSFEFEGAENFFVYDTIEWLSFWQEPRKREVLKHIRKSAWKPPRASRLKSDVNDPFDIYVIHRSKTYLDFEIEDMRIRVTHTQSHSGFGWTGLEIKLCPTVSITFDNPVSIDDALDRVWRIKGFFDQVATSDLRVKALSFSKFKKGWPAASVYLPNEIRKTAGRQLDIHPIYVPFSRWKERKKFQQVFKAWLQKSDKRRFFRAATRLSFLRLEDRQDPTLLPILMAGVESLKELEAPSQLSKETIALMVNAASEVEPTIELHFIKAALGALRRTSPRSRLEVILNQTLNDGDANEIPQLARRIVDSRNDVAHGRNFQNAQSTMTGTLAEFLANLCVEYDLETCGMPKQSEDTENRKTSAMIGMEQALMAVRTLATAEV
ncbi:MAG: hypothetical protein AAF553_03740 [Pseudomonadota bacterium]